jgi:hypothetical protein
MKKPTALTALTNSKFYNAWKDLKARCSNPKHPDYRYYGGRGIKVCSEWETFAGFHKDMYEPFLKHLKEFGVKDTSIDRIDNDGGYNKGNVRWATRWEQARNHSNTVYLEFENDRLLFGDWAKRVGMNYKTLYNRINTAGWSIKRALTTPVRQFRNF